MRTARVPRIAHMAASAGARPAPGGPANAWAISSHSARSCPGGDERRVRAVPALGRDEAELDCVAADLLGSLVAEPPGRPVGSGERRR